MRDLRVDIVFVLVADTNFHIAQAIERPHRDAAVDPNQTQIDIGIGNEFKAAVKVGAQGRDRVSNVGLRKQPGIELAAVTTYCPIGRRIA